MNLWIVAHLSRVAHAPGGIEEQPGAVEGGKRTIGGRRNTAMESNAFSRRHPLNLSIINYSVKLIWVIFSTF